MVNPSNPFMKGEGKLEEEVILNKILEEANQEANSVIAEAEEKARKMEEEITKNMTRQTEKQFEIMKQKIALEASSEIEKAEFEAKKSELLEKNKIIEIVKEKVKQKIKDLEEEKYIHLIDEKIKRYQNEKEVEVLLPKKCYEPISKLAIGYGMKVEQTESFEFGVIVRCGKIEYNYDFEENMKVMEEEIKKEIDTILFSNL